MKEPREKINPLPQGREEYLKERVQDQINWYDGKSGKNKRWFLRLKIMETILALFIPFLTGYITTNNISLKVVVGVLGIIVAAISGLVTLIKFQENWIEYRLVAESLKYEKFLFLAKTGHYKNLTDPTDTPESTASYRLFVERFESLISSSNAKWISYISKKESDKNDKKE